MATSDDSAHEDNIHPDKIFWFVVYLTTFGFMFILLITFRPIPKDNVRFADTCLGFILGSVITTALGYLLVGSPGKKVPSGNNTSEVVKETINSNKVTTTTSEKGLDPIDGK